MTRTSSIISAGLALAGWVMGSSETRVTDIEIGTEVLQPSVKRLGINLGGHNFYDSGQMMKDLLYGNPGFEGQIWNSIIRCQSGTATSCVDEDQWSGWPAGFWDGARFEIFCGAAAGRVGTVANSLAPSRGQGVTLRFSSTGLVPTKGDYLIVRKQVPGQATGGWWPTTAGGGEIAAEFKDLPPGTLGSQAVRLTAPESGSAILSSYRDTMAAHSFLKLNGKFVVTFKAKGLRSTDVNARASVQIVVHRVTNSIPFYLNENVSLTDAWKQYTFSFTASESGNVISPLEMQFRTHGADSFLLDDVSIIQVDSDRNNKTHFSDAVVGALQTLHPGILRFWADQLGDTLENLIAPPYARRRAGFSAWATEANHLSYGLHEFLELCEALRAEPWFVVPSTFSTEDAAGLIDYLAGTSGMPYGIKRGARGHATPWTQSFRTIHLEFGNEAWNSTFKGGNIEYPVPYAKRSQVIFAAMRAHPAFSASHFDLVLGGQAAWPERNGEIQNNCNNNDSFAVAPYTMGTVDSYADNESLFGSTFAEPEALVSKRGRAEGASPGLMYSNYRAIQTSSHPKPLSFYEINLGTISGSISQKALDSYASSLGAGLMVTDTMLLNLRQFGIVNQALFALPQYLFKRPDGKTVLLWGAVLDMGVTDRKRPQYLALELINQAIGDDTRMLRTVHAGADPAWDQLLVNSVELKGAHYLQSFAFSNNQSLSVIVFNLHRSAPLPVTFSGSNAPTGTVALQRLTSANPTDTNETTNIVAIKSSTLVGFDSKIGLALPPYSMTVLSWQLHRPM